MVLGEGIEDSVMSPLCWTAGNRLPMLLSYGERDSERVMRSNRRLLAMLQLQGGAASCRVEAGSDHFGTHTSLNDADHPWYGSLQRMVQAGCP